MPQAVLDQPWMQPVYDEPEFVVRNIWRLYGGWYDGNPARLKPPPDAALAAEVAALAGGVDALVARAGELAAAGDLRLAAQVAEWAVQAAPDDPAAHGARADVYTARRAEEASLMAKGIFGAAARRQPPARTDPGRATAQVPGRGADPWSRSSGLFQETRTMSDAIAPVPISDETTRRLFGEPSFRVAKRGGYDPGDVAEFLGGLGGQMLTLIGRLRKAESDVDVLKTELGHWQARTRDAEATRETFERTLALAEDTANAAVADARHRAAGIMTKAEANADELIGQARHQSFHMVEQAREEAQRCYADERMKVREEWQRVQDESAQLETLRLAVAAETMALEEVRNQLRTRIRMAATEMLKVAESPDCLGQPVARGMPEKPRAAAGPAGPARDHDPWPSSRRAPSATEHVVLEAAASRPSSPPRSVDRRRPSRPRCTAAGHPSPRGGRGLRQPGRRRRLRAVHVRGHRRRAQPGVDPRRLSQAAWVQAKSGVDLVQHLRRRRGDGCR